MSKSPADRASEPEEMVVKLCQVDLLVGQGQTVMEALKTIGVRLQDYRRWRNELEHLMRDETTRLAVLRAENSELRRLAGHLAMRTTLLRRAVEKAG